MPVRTPPTFLQAGSHPADNTRLMLQGLAGSPWGSFSGGVSAIDPGHGIVHPADLAVTQNGTPNMSVNVAAGGCFIRGTEAATQGLYHVVNDGVVNVTVPSSDPTNPRRDLVVIQVRDAAYSGSTNDARPFVVTGTPAASPADPTLPANCLVLARLAVAAASTSVVTGNITDLRTRARTAWNQGGWTVATFTLANFTFTTTAGQSAIFSPQLVSGRLYEFKCRMAILNGSATGTIDTVTLFDNVSSSNVATLREFVPPTTGGSEAGTFSAVIPAPGTGARDYRVRGVSSLAVATQTVSGLRIDVVDMGPAPA